MMDALDREESIGDEVSKITHKMRLMKFQKRFVFRQKDHLFSNTLEKYKITVSSDS